MGRMVRSSKVGGTVRVLVFMLLAHSTRYMLADNQPEHSLADMCVRPSHQLHPVSRPPRAILLACPAHTQMADAVPVYSTGTLLMTNPTIHDSQWTGIEVGQLVGPGSTLTLEKVGNLLFGHTPRQTTQLDHSVELDDGLLAQNVFKVLVAGTENWRKKNLLLIHIIRIIIKT